jgi:hypothetical protein
MLSVSWIGTDYEIHNKTVTFSDFEKAIIEFNNYCGSTNESAILVECESKEIIRQFVHTKDGYILK